MPEEINFFNLPMNRNTLINFTKKIDLEKSSNEFETSRNEHIKK